MDLLPLASRSETTVASLTPSQEEINFNANLQWDQTCLRINYIVQNLASPPLVPAELGGIIMGHEKSLSSQQPSEPRKAPSLPPAPQGTMASPPKVLLPPPGFDFMAPVPLIEANDCADHVAAAMPPLTSTGGGTGQPPGAPAAEVPARGVTGDPTRQPYSSTACWPTLSLAQKAVKVAQISTWQEEIASFGNETVCACSAGTAAIIDGLYNRSSSPPTPSGGMLRASRGLAFLHPSFSSPNPAPPPAPESPSIPSSVVPRAGSPAPSSPAGPVVRTMDSSRCSLCSRYPAPTPLPNCGDQPQKGSGGQAAKRAFRKIGDLVRIGKKKTSRFGGDIAGSESNTNTNYINTTTNDNNINNNTSGEGIPGMGTGKGRGRTAPGKEAPVDGGTSRPGGVATSAIKTSGPGSGCSTPGSGPAMYAEVTSQGVAPPAASMLPQAATPKAPARKPKPEPNPEPKPKPLNTTSMYHVGLTASSKNPGQKDDEEEEDLYNCSSESSGRMRKILATEARIRRARKLLERTINKSNGSNQPKTKADSPPLPPPRTSLQPASSKHV